MQCPRAIGYHLPNSSSFSSSPLDLVHADVWGPAPVSSFSGLRFYLLLVDDYSRFSWVYLLKHKSEVPTVFSHFKTHIENFLSKHIKVLRTDAGGEFISTKFRNFLAHNGIIHQVSYPYTSEQNGVTKRKHRHVIETSVAMLQTTSMPSTFWAKAVLTAISLINRLPTTVLQNSSLFYKLHEVTPDYNSLRVFGCASYPWLRPYASNKLEACSKLFVFIGYCSTSKGYRCYDRVTGKVYVSRHVLFRETTFPFQHNMSFIDSMTLPPVLGLHPTMVETKSDFSHPRLTSSSALPFHSQNTGVFCQPYGSQPLQTTSQEPLNSIGSSTPLDYNNLRSPSDGNHITTSATHVPNSQLKGICV